MHFEVNSESFPGWDLDDLEMFFKEIGEIQFIQTKENKTIIIYYRFYDALVAIEFFRNPQNFKEEMSKDTFNINWIDLNNEICKSFSDDVYNKIFHIYESIHNFYKDYFIKSNNFNLQNMQGGNFMGYQNWNINNMGQTMNYNYMNIQNMPVSNISNPSNISKNKDDENKSGKYTCRFEILLDNEKDFQIARKLIGAKGCNMKRIVENCGNDYMNDVKLRLRGKGSGFKEGPYNKESDDPLHLCISSKHIDKYQLACGLVNDLINTVYEEYKKHCYKLNKTPMQKIFRKIEEGISSRKSTSGYGNTNNSNMIA